MSFSYVFAVLYRGPMWHKAVLLIAAAPITVVMNSVRIAIAGWLVQYFGEAHLEGFSHFFEGWVIFMSSVLILFVLAWLMLKLQRTDQSLADTLELDFTGLWPQARRLGLIEPSKGLIAAVVILAAATTGWMLRPHSVNVVVDREPFALFPRTLGDWSSRPMDRLGDATERVLGADDYYRAQFSHADHVASVEFFSAYYKDQTQGGTHSPEICLPGAGWEIARLERVNIAPQVGYSEPFRINRAIIQKGEVEMLVYYWFESHGRHIAWDLEAKLMLLWDGFTLQRTDGALVRLTTPIREDETIEQSESRIQDMFLKVNNELSRFVPGL